MRKLLWMLAGVVLFSNDGLNAAQWVNGQPGSPRCVIFFEGNDCTAERSSCCTLSGPRMRECWVNDEARSMKVHGPRGTVITVFDDPGASTRDDYFVVTKGVDDPICIGSFDHAGQLLAGSNHQWFYSGGNGLDGKVSTFRWIDPRQPAVEEF